MTSKNKMRALKERGLSLSDRAKVRLLKNKDFLKKRLELTDYTISIIIESLRNKETKSEMVDFYGLNRWQMGIAIKRSSYERQVEFLLENEYNFSQYDMIPIIASMNNTSLIKFLNEHKAFLVQNNVSVYRIISSLSSRRQLNFMSRIEEAGLSSRRNKTSSGRFKARNKRENRHIKFPSRI